MVPDVLEACEIWFLMFLEACEIWFLMFLEALCFLTFPNSLRTVGKIVFQPVDMFEKSSTERSHTLYPWGLSEFR